MTIDVFNDVQCTRCADYQLDVIDPLINDYVRTGEAQMIFRHYPLGGKPVTLGGVAAEAAGEQDRQWQFIEVFVRNLDQVPEQGVNQEFLNEIAAAVPKLDVDRLGGGAVDGAEAEEAARAGNDLGTQLEDPRRPGRGRHRRERQRGARRRSQPRGDRGRDRPGQLGDSRAATPILARPRGVAQPGSAHRSGR